jgi:hypothetical protein
VERKISIMEEFAIIDETCYFCNHEQTVRFKEHYNFCPMCTAISTNMIPIEKCNHFTKDSMTIALREPWFSKTRSDGKPYVIGDESEGMGPCSICGKLCIADGW